MKQEPATDSRKDVMGLHSDFWTRFLLWLLRIFPAWFCVAMARPIALVFYACATPQRAAVISNLRVLHPRMSRAALWWAGSEVFLQFALTYMDRLWHLHLGRPLRWELDNCASLEARLARPGGVLLFTAHSGNYDIGAAYFARYFRRGIHTVRTPEKTRALQEFRKTELAQVDPANPRVHIHYSADEWGLGIELCGLLRNGEVVAVQGDRAVSASSPVQVNHDGIAFSLPRGPLVLAELARVPCFAVLLTRKGRCHYRLHASSAFHDGNPASKAGDIAQGWVSVLAPFIQRHWNQWYVFENMLMHAPTLRRDRSEGQERQQPRNVPT